MMAVVIAASGFSFAQKTDLKPTVRRAVYFDVSPSLKQLLPVQPAIKATELVEVPNKIGHKEFGHLSTNPFPFPEDKVWQKQDGTRMPSNSTTLQNFDGITNISGVYPPDTQGDVSPDHYVQVVNLNFAVYSKTGSLLLGPLALKTIWSGIPSPWNGTNNGDPVVLYDHAANRWLISQFSLPNGSTGGTYAELVAISQTSDPTGAWYRYVFEFGNNMPDYPKLGVWPDAYYMSVNQFVLGAAWGGVGACAFDRTKMIAGDPTASMVYFNLGGTSDPGGMLPSDWDGTTAPVAGEPNYFIYYNDWSSSTDDYLKVWQFHTDWTTPANSTFAESNSLVTSPFDSELCTADRGKCVPQPGTAIKLESLSDRLMYRLQYRNFGTHQSMVTNHTVDVDGSGRAGIRWYELRNSGSGWSIYQQGTYSPDASSRWVGSVAMNGQGDIALGYSVSDATLVSPSIRYTGRMAYDDLGLMTIPEHSIIAGTGVQTGTAARWGDYSMMSVDPTDDLTFWYTTEYIQTTGSATWKTRIASLKFDHLPLATTLAATAITGISATANGMIFPNGLSTNYHFEWGTTTSYDSTTAITSAGSGNAAVSVSAVLTGLTSGQTYHFRLVAVNSEGTSTGNDLTFIPGVAVVTTAAATSVTSSGAVTGGNVITDGGMEVTARGICWGLTINPLVSGNHTTDGSGTGPFISSLAGLTGNTTYHIRAYATSASGMYYGNDLTFTTLCNIIAIFPWNEGFENGGLIPGCWSQEQVSSSGISWIFVAGNGASNPSTAHGGTYDACLKDVNTTDNRTRLISPRLDLTSVDSPQLKFWHIQASWSGRQDQLSVYYKASATDVWTLLISYTTSVTAWTQRTISLPNPTGDYYLAFEGNAKWGRGVCIDDVQVSSSCVSFLPVSVSIAASANPVCAGTSVTFTATPNNGGTTPRYQWSVNGNSIAGATNSTYTYPPVSNDLVMCMLTSNASCVSGNPATSNSLAMTVNPLLPVRVTISVSANPVMAGTEVTFTALPRNGGIAPVYQWTVNGVVASGATTSTYTYTPLSGDHIICTLTSDELCASSNPAVSNEIVMVVNSVPLSIELQNITVADTECFNAIQTILVAGNGNVFTIQNGGSASLIAGENILYYPGTIVEAGGYMFGSISSGGPWCTTVKAVAIKGTTEIPQQLGQQFYRIYPNPTAGTFMLEFQSAEACQNSMVEIFDRNGQRMFSITLTGESGHEFSLSGKPAGIYLLRVINDRNSGTTRIIKMD